MEVHILLSCCLLATICFLTQVQSDDVIIQKRVDDSDLAAMFDPKRKKPFCNAFTGCGRKRSDESMATLVDLNSEPAVEELSRQILSEAKLWEAIQEARQEILRRRQHQSEKIPSIPFSLTGMRKKRSIKKNP
ncbi:crustacean cardioactive peptide [Lycorma delicatula]|uniref:crustacean cardioactive peptide n=1 Tax=Lycorma delicatula TaxID=130591 RepID=UPI003F5194A3